MADPLEALGIDDPRRRGLGRRWVRALIALVVLGALAAALAHRLRPRPPTYDTAAAVRGDLVATVGATGSLRPVRVVEVGAEISGRVVAVHVDVNDVVRAGDVLVEIDTAPIDANVSRAEASVLEARAAIELATSALDDARTRLERATRLAASGHGTDADRDAAAALVRRAEAELDGARARSRMASAGLRESNSTRARSVVRAPIDGIVLTRTVQPGQTVAATLAAPTLLTLAEDLRALSLHVDVDEADVARVRDGMEVRFSVDAHPDRAFTGRVERVAFAGRLVQNVVSYETIVSVRNDDLSLRPGMTATATIVVETRRGVLLVPNAALRFAPRAGLRVGRDRRWDAPRGPTVYRLEGGQPRPVSVRVLGADEARTQVEGEGLAPGVPIVLEEREATR